MIGYLEGKIKEVLNDSIIVDISGVGYRVFLGEDILSLKKGDEVQFYIYTHVRENEIKLFGFDNKKQLILFEMLQEVNGVGPKAALAILNKIGIKQIVNSILNEKPKGLKAKGVGIKTANKIVLELKDKLGKEGFTIDEKVLNENNKMMINKEKLEEVSDALVSLGYLKRDVDRMLEEVLKNDKVINGEVEEIIKYLLSKRKAVNGKKE